MLSRVFGLLQRTARWTFVIAGVTAVGVVNIQPWHRAGAIFAKKIGTLQAFNDLGWVPIAGGLFKFLATATAGIMAYGLYSVCQFLEIALLLGLQAASPTLWVSAGAAFVIDIALNCWQYPPIQVSKDTWNKLLMGEPLTIDFACLFMMLVSVLSMELSTRLFWYPLVKGDLSTPTTPTVDPPQRSRAPKSFRRRRKRRNEPTTT